MKITCQSCQSKYNVADEKVQGKVVKIRCRKCGATIVVNGTAAGATNGSSPSPAKSAAGPGPKAQAAEATPWHVNVAENDQRTMSLAELVDAHASGLVTHDTFVWTDGMDDWKALGEVDAIVAALGVSGSQAEPPASVVPNGFGESFPSSVANPSHDAPGGLPQFADDAGDGATRVYQVPQAQAALLGADVEPPAPATAGGRADAKRAAVVRRERPRDLFASRAEEGPQNQDVQTSAPVFAAGALTPSVESDPSRRTGERNESSVLFSLAVLTQNADQRTPLSEARLSDDSGLIDLKALAAKTESMRPPTGMGDGSPFGPPLGAIGPFSAPAALGSPLGLGQESAQPKSRLPMLIGLGAVAVLLMVVGVVIGIKFSGGGPVAAPSAEASGSAAASATASAEAEPTAASASSLNAIPSAAPSPAAGQVAVKPRVVVGGGGGGNPRPVIAAKPPAAAGGNEAPAAAPAPAPPPPKKTNDCGCNGDLMCLMKCSTH